MFGLDTGTNDSSAGLLFLQLFKAIPIKTTIINKAPPIILMA
jgi:hypothetical protein